MTTQTKAARIMALHATGLSTREIAIQVYGEDCDVPLKMAYVRVVVNQRKGRGASKHDLAYQKSPRGAFLRNGYRRKRYAADPEYRAVCASHNRRYLDKKALDTNRALS